MRYPAIVLLVLVAACQRPVERTTGGQERLNAEAAVARSEIGAANERFSRYVAAGQLDSMLSHFVNEVRWAAPNMPFVAGRDSVRARFAEMMKLGTWNINLHTDSVFANGTLVVEMGHWDSHLTPTGRLPAGVDTVDSGRYMRKIVRDGSGLWIEEVIYNSDRALPRPSAASRPAR